MTKAEKIENTSTAFFFIGGFFAKIRIFTLFFFPGIFNFISLSAYFIAYSLWMLTTREMPEHFALQTQWYGFTQFKNQHFLAAGIGLLATVLSIASLFLPPLFVAACWLYAASNIVWSISEYHKLKNPPGSKIDDTQEKQVHYLHYTLFMAANSIVSAVAASLVLLFPPLTVVVFFISTFAAVGLTYEAIKSWLEYKYVNDKTLYENDHPIEQNTINSFPKELSKPPVNENTIEVVPDISDRPPLLRFFSCTKPKHAANNSPKEWKVSCN